MRRLGLAAALLLLAAAALANPGDARVSVTLKPDVLDARATGEQLVATYGGRLIETTAQTVVLEISVARSGLLARDPRVALVAVLGSQMPAPAAAPARRPLQPRPTADDPCTTAPIGLPRCTGFYQYDGAGNIKAIGNDVFRYDAVGRLKNATLASAPGSPTENYQYDAFGNMIHVSGASRPLLTTEPATNHLKTANAQETYDEAGNLATWSDHAYSYDAANMLTEMTESGGVDMMYAYSADDERIATLSVSPSGYIATWRIRGLDNKVLREFREEKYAASTQPWSWKRDYVYRGDLLLSSYALSESGTTQRLDYHLDHLGTPRLITDDAGQQVSVHHYYPFGREITEPAGETMKFTGHERDSTPYDYQDYMHARYDNPFLGRFLSVDPGLGSPQRPQSWNRYAYVENNPVGRTDPTGESWVGDLFQGIDDWWHKKMNQWFPPKQVQNDPNREALNEPAVGNTPAQTERLVNPAGTAQRGLNEAGATLGAEFTKQGVLQIATVATPVLFKAALKPFNKELNAAGRALTKHPQVLGFADTTALQAELRSTAAINEAGSRAVANILDNGIQTVINHPRYGQIIQVQVPGGFGARWSAATKEFIGFINP